MSRTAAVVVALLAGAIGCVAAPISLKELDLMVRMGISEQAILRDVQTRKLLSPIDVATEKSLVSNGASAALLQQLKQGGFAVSGAEAAKVQQLQDQSRAAAAKEHMADAAALAAHEEELRQAAARSSAGMHTMFTGKLQRMENGSLQSYSGDLRNVRYFLLYYSAHWCGPCRQFTPELVKFYQEFKPRHPEFEVIFISNDRSAADMQQYMKSAGMPWPAVRFDQIDSKLQNLAGSGIPWLAIYNADGEPGSSNAKTKQWIDPAKVLVAFEQALGTLGGR